MGGQKNFLARSARKIVPPPLLSKPWRRPYARYSDLKYDLSNGAIFNDLEDPYPQFQGHAILYAECLRNGTTYKHSFKEILIATYTRPTQGRRSHRSWGVMTPHFSRQRGTGGHNLGIIH